MNLRSKVSNIMETETSWNVSEQSIEEFIEGDLEGELLREFKAELAENSDLMAEVELRKQVNEVIGEIDIRELKASLKAAKDMVEESKVRRFIPETNNKVFKFLRVSAAIMVLLLGIASLLNSGYISSDNAYVNFFESPSWASERSVSADFSFMKKAQAAYINEDFQTVFEMKKEAPESMLNNPVFLFYTGASMQNLNKYAEAVKEYTKVINHGDNMYIEEARWYRSLCYIKLDDMDKAKQELLAVINRNGYYTQEAKAIMRRLRFSLE